MFFILKGKILLRRGILLLLTALLGAFIYFIFDNSRHDPYLYAVSVLERIEKVCSSDRAGLFDKYQYASDSQYGVNCVIRGIQNSSHYLDSEIAAKAMASLYGKEEFPEITNNCHVIVHELGQSAQSKGVILTADHSILSLCSAGFLHGYYENILNEIDDTNFEVAGFTKCSELATYPGGGYDCAHALGHLIYTRGLSGKTNTENIELRCGKILKEFQFTCLNGFFMEKFGNELLDLESFKERIKDLESYNFNSCLNYSINSVKESCILMSWGDLVAFYQTKGNPAEDILRFFVDDCSRLSEDLQFTCGMSIGFMAHDLSSGDRSKVKNYCAAAADSGVIDITDGCLVWGARTLWRQTHDNADFDTVCSAVTTFNKYRCTDMWKYLQNESPPATHND